jgi:hypothetical protein
MIRRTTILLAAFALACSGNFEGSDAEHVPEIGSAREPVFGSLDPSNLLQLYAKGHTVPIRNLGTDAAGDGVCTGTQVRRNVIITAVHCITKNGLIVGSIVNTNQMLIGRPGLDSWNLVPTTFAACQASLDCTTVKTYVTNSVNDVAVLYLEPTEARFGLDDIIYVPLIASNPTQVNTTVEIAGYGKYNPFNNADPANFALNFARLTVTAVDTPNTVTGNVGGVTTKFSGNDSNKVQGGDSGSGLWTQTTPPGILAVMSGAQQSCNWDVNLCTTAQGPTPFGFNGRFVNGEMNEGNVYPVGARDWEFNAAAEFGDFDQVKADPSSGSSGWQVSSGNFTPWNNANASFMLARTVMETGCVQTAVRTTDNDESGLVFRHMDNANYYLLAANDQANRISIKRNSNGTFSELARATWNGTWATSTPLLVCFYGRNIQAWINPGTASEIHLAAVEPSSTPLILGGRLGLWNDFNQAARHGYLRTMSIEDGQARVNTFLRL